MAKRRLSTANNHLKSNELTSFYEEIFKALYGYLGDKMNIPIAEFNKDNIASVMEAKSVTESTVSKMLETLDRCEMARFAPGDNVSAQSVYSAAMDSITLTEDELA